MTPANVFQLEIASALAGRRTLLMRLGLPCLLALPFVLFAMPVRARVAGLVMLVVFVSFFGAAVGQVRRRNDGHLTRLRLLPIPPWLVWCDQLLASAAADFAQMAPPLLLFVIVNGRTFSPWPLLGAAGLFCAAVLLLNGLGMLLALAMKSNPEVHLAGALAVGVIAFFSGIFPVPPRVQGIVGAVASWSPVARFASAFAGLADGSARTGPGAAVVGLVALAVVAVALALRSVEGRGEAGLDKTEAGR